MVRVAVIGAGASGLTALKACLEEGLDVVCFEKTEDLGGLWTYREHNVDGVASVMFSTTTNSSKELSAFSDFPPPSQYPNYMHHRLVSQYLNDYADTFGLRSYVRCLHSVTKVSFFAFPKDPLLKKRWLVAIKRDEGKLFAVTKHTKVCSTHFANDDYLPNVVGGRRYLRVDAVPSVFAFGKPQRPARRKPRDRQQCVSRAQRLSAIGQAGSSELALETTLSPGGDVAVSRDCATAEEVLDATECSDSASAPTSAADFQERQEVCGCAATGVNLEEQLSEHQARIWKAI
ncbi:hypothetical protein HPB50_012608 [Hyalomma asiaticum]|uniref:Uncharacterized protein n=1 Tax=Hyalomma asiaticum TaxID=266040 RepID=A0ACB7S9F6_HYAAI|nr:hypothetical protein HPB50_012608 [Hyalomma asiaticum]